jgi:hypothetical protein
LPLKATLVWTDLPANAGSSVHIVNDLHLKLTSPDLSLFYWGNRGLTGPMAGNWSTSGGGKDVRNTVENVFIQSPQAGSWTIEVYCQALPMGGSIDFGLVVSGVAPPIESHEVPDWDGDKEVMVTDLARFLADFAAANADVDGDSQTTASDFWSFLDSLFGAPASTRR